MKDCNCRDVGLLLYVLIHPQSAHTTDAHSSYSPPRARPQARSRAPSDHVAPRERFALGLWVDCDPRRSCRAVVFIRCRDVPLRDAESEHGPAVIFEMIQAVF